MRHLIAALSACGGGGADTAPPATVAAPTTVTICPGVTTTTRAASEAIQRCADTTGVLDLQAVTYVIDKALIFTKPLTIRGNGAVWQASPNITGTDKTHPMVTFPYTPGKVDIEGLTLDGNRQIRGGAKYCNGTTDAYAGGNILIDHADGVTIKNMVSKNAVCGSGMHFWGDRASITGSTFENNGEHKLNQWADGLTMLHCSNCDVSGNRFINNSDVGLVFGGGVQTTIARNAFTQDTYVFAALSMDNFNGSTSGNFAGSVLSNNTIDCGAFNCSFGVNIGPGAWYPSANITGGTVANNTISGAKIGILVSSASNVTVYSNAVTGSATGYAQFQCGPKLAGDRIVSLNSTVDTAGELGWIVRDHTGCP